MDISDFIAETISQIYAGVDKAIAANPESAINPLFARDEGSPLVLRPEHAVKVEFDILLSAGVKSGAEGGGGIKVLPIDIGGKVSSTSEEAKAHRVKFSIPIIPRGVRVTPGVG